MEFKYIKKIIIVDSNIYRAESIAKIMKECGVNVEHISNVLSASSKDGKLLEPRKHLFEGVNLIFIHMGPPQADKMLLPGSDFGNAYSMEFFIANKDALKNICVVAYTGGDKTEPSKFKEYKEEGWHQYFSRVSNGKDLNIQYFLNRWQDCTKNPPLAVLENSGDLVMAFKILITGFKIAHGADFPIRYPNEVAKSWTESLSWWEPVLGSDQGGEDLKNKLKEIGENDLVDLVNTLKKWISSASKKWDEEQNICSKAFESNAFEALKKAKLWAPRNEG